MIIGYIIKRWIGELKYDKYEKIYEQNKNKIKYELYDE